MLLVMVSKVAKKKSAKKKAVKSFEETLGDTAKNGENQTILKLINLAILGST